MKYILMDYVNEAGWPATDKGRARNIGWEPTSHTLRP